MAALDAAVRLFLTQGFGNTSLSQVASAADVSTATLFKYFPTKANLFGAVMARLWEADGSAHLEVPNGLSVADGLRLIGTDYARLLNQEHTVALFRVIIAEVPRFPELGRELYERGKKPYLDRVEWYLQTNVTAGAVDAPDIPLAARQFLGMINDVVFWPRLLIMDLQLTPADVQNVIDQAVTTFIARYRSSVGS